jgi:pyruvate dehydrogenase E2 component (dihydrolipoamide acetyltransferase)
MVPVIRNADLLPLPGLSAEAKRVATACMDGSIQPDELAGATFTVSNLGSLGVESFTPVLDPPQVGILGVGTIAPAVVRAADGSPAVEPRMGLSLTVDHRVIDGAPAARILGAFADAIAEVDLPVV